MPGRLPDVPAEAPIHDGYYEVRGAGRQDSRAAYAHMAARDVFDRQLGTRLARGETIDDALRETEAWFPDPDSKAAGEGVR